MLEQFLVNNIVFALIVWLAVYLGDYYLTIYGARLYMANGKDHLTVQGSYELTPKFQNDVDQLKLFSPRFFFYVVLSSVLIGLVWFATVKFFAVPEWFLFLLGGLILREGVVYIRHWRNIVLFRLSAEPYAIEGKIGYSRWATYKMSAAELYGMAGLYSFLVLVTGSGFVLGGAFACAVLGIQHQLSARKILKNTEAHP